MAYVVTQYCFKCKYTDCVSTCPVEAFHEGPDMLYINPETCIDCDACREACPVGAIFIDADVPEKWKAYVAYNAAQSKVFPSTKESTAALPTAQPKEALEKLEAEGKLPSPF